MTATTHYAFSYLRSVDDPRWAMQEDEWEKRHRRDLQKLDPDLHVGWWKTSRIKYASPHFQIGYQCPPVRSRTSPSPLYTGVYMKYPQPRTMQAALLSGEQTARAIIGAL